MTAACSHDLSAESWIDFFADELEEAAGDRFEQLLFECTQCAADAERWGAVVGATGFVIPPGRTRALIPL